MQDTCFHPETDLHPRQLAAFLNPATETLYGGAAGSGKSFLIRYLALWVAFHAPGVQVYLFRRTYPDLRLNHMEGPTSFPALLAPFVASGHCAFNEQKGSISFWNGSRIFLCHCQYEKNLMNYQGAEIHLLLIDELTHFSEKMYRFLRGRCRLGSWKPPKQLARCFPKIFCGSNPGGIGHSWTKEMFVTSAEPGKVWRTPRKEGGMLRCFVPARLSDNPTMLLHDPDYADRLSALGDPALVKAMLEGNWDIVSGGALDDVWKPERQIVQAFKVPGNWPVDRSFDWGSSAPFSVGWWAVSNGEEVRQADGTVRAFPPGSLIRIAEWYGWNGKPNEGCKLTAGQVAQGILERERTHGSLLGLRIRPGPADSAIFASDGGHCIADDMARQGVRWTAANKGAGSRVSGLEKVRAMLRASGEAHPEQPGLYAFSHCLHYIRTLPVLPRSTTNPEDVDTNAEDHVFDEVRYRCAMPSHKMTIMEV